MRLLQPSKKLVEDSVSLQTNALTRKDLMLLSHQLTTDFSGGGSLLIYTNLVRAEFGPKSRKVGGK